MEYFVYILICSDNTYYTGITTDINRRLMEHNGNGGRNKGAKYTRYRRPVRLVYSQNFLNRSEASKEENRIKKLSRKEKLALIESSDKS